MSKSLPIRIFAGCSRCFSRFEIPKSQRLSPDLFSARAREGIEGHAKPGNAQAFHLLLRCGVKAVSNHLYGVAGCGRGGAVTVKITDGHRAKSSAIVSSLFV